MLGALGKFLPGAGQGVRPFAQPRLPASRYRKPVSSATLAVPLCESQLADLSCN
jgi:hypothetical protein